MTARPPLNTMNTDLTPEQKQVIADLLALFGTPLPCGDWDGTVERQHMIDARMVHIHPLPPPSEDVLQFFKRRSGC